MKLDRVHFIREILDTDNSGNAVPIMQFSYDRASTLNPVFMIGPTYYQTPLHSIYRKLGGSRPEGSSRGSTVIVPQHSGWTSLWDWTAGQVRVVADTELPTEST